MTGYCVKCKQKDVEMQNPQPVTKETKRGPVNFMTGKCPKCGTAMWRVVSRGPKKEEASPAPTGGTSASASPSSPSASSGAAAPSSP